MKITACLLFCILAVASAKPKEPKTYKVVSVQKASIESAAAELCAQENSEGVLVADKNCNRFNICNGGKPVTLDCPRGLLYNIAYKYCDWPLNVECGDRTIYEVPEESEDIKESNENDDCDDESNGNGEDGIWTPENGHSDPSQAPAICAAEGSDGVLVPHENCNRFYKCSEGKPVALDCPANLLYNFEAEYCDWESNVDCGDRTIAEKPEEGPNENNGNSGGDVWTPENGHSDPSQASAICAAEGSDGILVPHENCNRFYKCSEGKPVALDCPANLLYNIKAQYCDWESNVDCGDRTIAEKPEEGPNENNGNSGGDVWTPENGHSDPSQASAICAAEGSDGILVPHENCNRFYKCSEGKPVALDCPANLLYNIKAQYCDWESNVDCSDRTIAEKPEEGANENNGNGGGDVWTPENGHSEPSQAPAICAAEGSDGVLVSHENCNRFYKCSEGKPVAFDCPANLLYNFKAEYCDWESNVDCGDRTIAETPEEGPNENNGNGDGGVWTPENGHSDPSQAPTICAVEGSSGVLVAHENCSKFYKCDGGKPVSHDCPSNLLYQPEHELCDWPQNVNCAGRI